LVVLLTVCAYFVCEALYNLATGDAIEEQRQHGREVQWRR
jgi:hypothetical protein